MEEMDQGGTERSSKRSKFGEELEHQLQLRTFFPFPFFSSELLICLYLEPSDSLSCEFTDIMDPTDLDCSLCMR